LIPESGELMTVLEGKKGSGFNGQLNYQEPSWQSHNKINKGEPQKIVPIL
jgi:hypothetical protein